MRLHFTKMAGAGNDFILVDNRSGILKKDLPGISKRLSDRKFSIGADGLILLEKSKKADVRMRIFNSDGSEAEMCGNGARCAAEFAVRHGISKRSRLSLETPAGVVGAQVRREAVKIKMVDPTGLRLGIPLTALGRSLSLHFIDTGVPHAVCVTEDLGDVDVASVGRVIRRHETFAPKGVNADFIAMGPGNAIRVRTYERGVEGETLSCGTGSTAGALVAAVIRGLRSPVRVHTQSGETLTVYFEKKGNRFQNVYLEGRVRTAFEGRVDWKEGVG